jgi:hypothetical protein
MKKSDFRTRRSDSPDEEIRFPGCGRSAFQNKEIRFPG